MTVATKIMMGSGAVAEAYEIEQSLIFQPNAHFSRNVGSASNRKTWTWSAWVKRSALGLSNDQMLFNAGPNGSDSDSSYFAIRFGRTAFGAQTDALVVNGWNTNWRITNRLFRDVSAWYHIVVVLDTTQSTADNRIKVYINGTQETSFQTTNNPSQDATLGINLNQYHMIGAENVSGSDRYFSGQMAEVNFVDGTALDPSSFGETSSDTGQWIPKEYSGSYGTNGFYLKFVSGALGTDSSGEGNNYSAANLANSDVVIDTPTNNFATLNPLAGMSTTAAFTEGNQAVALRSAGVPTAHQAVSTMSIPTSGKWYWELRILGGGYPDGFSIGMCPQGNLPALADSGNFGYDYYNVSGGKKYNGESRTSYGSAWFTQNQQYIMSVYYDADNTSIGFKLNGTDQGFAFTNVNPVEYLAAFRNNSGGTTTSPILYVNFGQNGTFNGAVTAQGNADANGIGDFYYAPPSGYLALCTANLSDPAIPLPSAQFNTVLYTGNGSTQSISGVGHQPDWVWIKNRATTDNHVLTDAVRGATIQSGSNLTGAEVTNDDGLTAFASDGFAIGDDVEVNTNSEAYVSWNWKANGSGSTNTVGSLDAVVSANAAAGFSIVTYTGNGSAQSIGHGLSKDLEFLVVKNRDANASWVVQVSTTVNDYMYLNGTDGIQQSSIFGLDITRSNDGTFYYGGPNYMGANGVDYLAYCFHSIEGYSKIGFYTGNGSADGPMVNTGFKPAWLMIKNTSNAQDWILFDNKRDPFNVTQQFLYPNLSNAEAAGGAGVIDLLSNGFKLRNAGTRNRNYNGDVYLFMAFADSPFKSATAH